MRNSYNFILDKIGFDDNMLAKVMRKIEKWKSAASNLVGKKAATTKSVDVTPNEHRPEAPTSGGPSQSKH